MYNPQHNDELVIVIGKLENLLEHGVFTYQLELYANQQPFESSNSLSNWTNSNLPPNFP